MTRIFAVLNQKGGVGKTTTCVNLGAALARRGFRVLLIDMDPQANLTVHLGADLRDIKRSSYSLLLGEHALGAAVRQTKVPGLMYVPSTLALANAEIQLASAVGRELILRENIEAWLEDDSGGAEIPRAHFILIDCPPSLGILTMNALCAANEVILPIQTEFFALQGIAGILESLKAVQRLNRGLRLSMVVPCMWDRRTTLARDVIAEVENYFGKLVAKTRIRNNVKLAEAPSHGQTIFEYDASSNGAKDYTQLAKEILGEPVEVEKDEPKPARRGWRPPEDDDEAVAEAPSAADRAEETRSGEATSDDAASDGASADEATSDENRSDGAAGADSSGDEASERCASEPSVTEASEPSASEAGTGATSVDDVRACSGSDADPGDCAASACERAAEPWVATPCDSSPCETSPCETRAPDESARTACGDERVASGNCGASAVQAESGTHATAVATAVVDAVSDTVVDTAADAHRPASGFESPAAAASPAERSVAAAAAEAPVGLATASDASIDPGTGIDEAFAWVDSLLLDAPEPSADGTLVTGIGYVSREVAGEVRAAVAADQFARASAVPAAHASASRLAAAPIGFAERIPLEPHDPWAPSDESEPPSTT
ncbi:MAG: Nitrogenase iron protein [Planctomycetes bacterium]|nr:Nitrogenase iron protein [Planctomycetota bacterium]